MTKTKSAENMKPLTETILEHAAELREGALIRANNLLDLGNRAAIDQALSRLVKRGQFLRVSRGIYVRTIEGEFGNYAPSVEKVVKNIALLTGETIIPHAAISAKNWGLTTQVPLRIGYITSGKERTLTFHGRIVKLRAAPPWQFDVGKQAAGEALRVLYWIGPAESPDALRKLKRKLSASDFCEMRMLVSTHFADVPSWIAKQVRETSVNG